jgi:hypothetical protein
MYPVSVDRALEVRMRVLAFVAALGCAGSPPPRHVPTNTGSPSALAPTTPARPVVKLTGGLPVGTGAYGTDNPGLVRAHDFHERWMAVCQARKDTDGDGKIEIHTGHHGELWGDDMQLYLILGGGEGTPIDAIPSWSADGRYVSVLRDTKLWIVDTQTGEQHALVDADIESDDRPGTLHRAGRFSGNRLLYVRHRAMSDTLVIHDPKTHAEREVPYVDRIWRVVAQTAQVAQVVTVPQGQGFPRLMSSLGRGECLGSPMSYSTGGQGGPTPTFTYVDLDTGKPLAGDGIVAIAGNAAVRSPKDGALYIDNDQVAPPTCAPQVLAVLPSPPRAIAICGAKKQARVLLLGKGLSRELAAIDRDVDKYEGVDEALTATGVVCDATGKHCVAVATGASVDLKGGTAEHVWNARIYVKTLTAGQQIVDAITRQWIPTTGSGKQFAVESIVLDGTDHLIDLATGKDLGRAKDVVRIGATGRVLRGPGKDMTGPFSWSAP